jgi:hypothetical protein
LTAGPGTTTRWRSTKEAYTLQCLISQPQIGSSRSTLSRVHSICPLVFLSTTQGGSEGGIWELETHQNGQITERSPESGSPFHDFTTRQLAINCFGTDCILERLVFAFIPATKRPRSRLCLLFLLGSFAFLVRVQIVLRIYSFPLHFQSGSMGFGCPGILELVGKYQSENSRTC